MRSTDPQLVFRTLDGDSSAFDELVERYRTRVFHCAMRMVGLREDAVDIAQEAFVRAYMSLRTLHDPERFGPWLMTITGNLCRMRLRQSRESVVPIDLLDGMRASSPDPPQSGVREALERLPEGTRIAASMFFIDGIGQTEIAGRLGISLAAVKARIREARARLRKEMVDMTGKQQSKDELGEEFMSSLKHRLELARWYAEVAEHIESGGNFMSGLESISAGGYSQPVIDATRKMIEEVKSGRPVSAALADSPILGGRETSPVMRAAEQIGSIHIAARILSDWMDVQDAQRDIELIFWLRTLAYLLTAKTPMSEVLNYGLGISQGKALRQATREIVEAIESDGGDSTRRSLREVLDRYTDVFPPIARVAILAGESVGRVDKGLFWSSDVIADDLAGDIARNLIPAPRELGPRRFWNLGIDDALRSKAIELLSDPAPEIRAASVDVLGRIGSAEDAPRVLGPLDDDSPEVRRMTARTIAKLGYKQAEESLARRLDDPEPAVRKAVIGSMAAMELHSSAGAIAAKIEDHDYPVMMSAIDALQSMGEEDVLRDQANQMLWGSSVNARRRGAYLMRYFLPPEVAQTLLDRLAGKPSLSLDEMNAVVMLSIYDVDDARSIVDRMLGDPRIAPLAESALREVSDADLAAAIRHAVESGSREDACVK